MSLDGDEINDLGRRLAQSDDPAEIDWCLERLQPEVIRWAQQLLFRKGRGNRDPERLDSFPKEVLGHLFAMRRGFDPERGIPYGAWCRAVIYNYWVDTRRRRAREFQWPADSEDDSDFDPVIKGGVGYARTANREELDNWLNEVRMAYDDASEPMTQTSSSVDFFAVALLLGRFRFARLCEQQDLSPVSVDVTKQTFWGCIEQLLPWHDSERERGIRFDLAPLDDIWTKFTELVDIAEPGEMARATLLLRQAIGEASEIQEPLPQATWDQWTRRCKHGANQQKGLCDVLGKDRYNRVLAPLLESRPAKGTSATHTSTEEKR